MYGSSKIELNDLTPNERLRLRLLSEMSRKLYNRSMKIIIDTYENQGKVLYYDSLKPLVKDTEEYKNITGYYYATICAAVADFRKYLSTDMYVLSKADRTIKDKNLDKFYPPKLRDEPRIIEMKQPLIKDGFVILPATKQTPPVKLRIPECYRSKDIRAVTIRPLHNMTHWEMIISYPLEAVHHSDLDYSHALGIDLGMVNFATCADSVSGECFIVDGKGLKSILQGYSKYLASLRRASGKNDTKRIAALKKRTYQRVNNFVGKATSYIIKYCLEHGIGKVCLGWGVHFQGQGSNLNLSLGVNNQLFYLFPFAKFKNALQAKCQLHGIHFVLVDESYTSQASALDNDTMPEHITGAKQQFSGKRIHRGLYMSADGIKTNADQNAVWNILRKGSVTLPFLEGADSRGLMPPYRVKVI